MDSGIDIGLERGLHNGLENRLDHILFLRISFIFSFQALQEVNPRIFTIATLTGHVIRVYGPNYSAALDNGPAWAKNTSRELVEIGDQTGDPFEISRLRREVREIASFRYLGFCGF